MEKIYRVQMNKHGMPDFSTAEEVEPIEVHKYCWSKEFGSGESCNHEFDPNGVCKDCGFMNVRYAVEPKQGEWIPCSERLPSEEERKEWIDNNLDGIGNLYPCLVTRYSSINPDRTKNNPYVAKHYFDGEDFVNCGEEVCSEYILAWMPLPEPWKGADDEQAI